MSEDRLKTVIDYRTVNAQGIETISAHIEIADQSPASASEVLLNLMEGLAKIPQVQVTKK